MINKLIFVESNSFYPYYNQAIEASLLDMVDDETLALYIWANDKTVFIGKNQNAYSECNIQKLKENGGYLARRLSGGGAVYHDKGNLNFTFVCSKKNYSLKDNFNIMLSAIRSFGIDAQLSGRNDCTVDGKKFSGNAFYTKEKCFHHGTILINTMASEIGKYLNISKAKLNSKGVKSVVSRVTNLSLYSSDVNYSTVRNALKRSFVSYYSCATLTELFTEDIDKDLINKWLKYFSNESLIMGDDINYNFRIEHSFAWGLADLRLQITDGVIKNAKIYTDSLEYEMSQKETELIGQNVNSLEQSSVLDILSVVREAMNS